VRIAIAKRRHLQSSEWTTLSHVDSGRGYRIWSRSMKASCGLLQFSKGE